LQCRPELYSHEIYNSHIQDAVKRAQEWIQKAEAQVEDMINSIKKKLKLTS